MKTHKIVTTLVALSAAAALMACGGKKGPTKPGGGDSDVVGEQSDGTVVAEAGGSAAVQGAVEVSENTEKDFMEVLKEHQAADKEGWTSASCNSMASKWKSLADKYSKNKLVEAEFNAGLAYHECGMLDAAEKQYREALKLMGSHAQSISNIGEIKFAKGDVSGAKQQWELALKNDAKLIAARNNLAYLMLQDLRATSSKSAWSSLEKKIRDELSSVLAVDQSNAKAYTLYGLVYLEGSERNKNRLDLAKLLMDEAKKHDPNYPSLHNAYGLLYMRRQQPGIALEKFTKAVELDGNFLEARMNVGNITLNFRKYDVASEQFKYVVGKDGKNYDALIGLGIAQRGLNQLDDAEKSYNTAIKVDSKRGEAYFNLGVLYKDFRANKASDLNESIGMYKKAKSYFSNFLSKSGTSAEDKEEAKQNMKDCDKTIDQIEKAIKALKAAEAAGG